MLKCLIIALFLTLALGITQALDQIVTWTGSGDGMNWSDPANWDPMLGLPPCNFDVVELIVVIPDGISVTHNAGTCTIKEITLSASSTLTLPAGCDLTVTGPAHIGGFVHTTGGHLTAMDSGTEFTGNQARVCAASGSVVKICAPAYSSTGITSTEKF